MLKLSLEITKVKTQNVLFRLNGCTYNTCALKLSKVDRAHPYQTILNPSVFEDKQHAKYLNL